MVFCDLNAYGHILKRFRDDTKGIPEAIARIKQFLTNPQLLLEKNVLFPERRNMIVRSDGKNGFYIEAAIVQIMLPARLCLKRPETWTIFIRSRSWR